MLLTPCLACLFVRELPRPLLLHVWDALLSARGALALTHGCLALVRALAPAIKRAITVEDCLELLDSSRPQSHRAGWLTCTTAPRPSDLEAAARDVHAVTAPPGVHRWLTFLLAFDQRMLCDEPMVAAIRARVRGVLARAARASELAGHASKLERHARALRQLALSSPRPPSPHATSTSLQSTSPPSAERVCGLLPHLEAISSHLEAISSEAAMRAAALDAGLCEGGDGAGLTAVRRLLPRAIEARTALEQLSDEAVAAQDLAAAGEAGVTAGDTVLEQKARRVCEQRVQLLRTSMDDVARLCAALEAEAVRPLSAAEADLVCMSLGAHRKHARAIAERMQVTPRHLAERLRSGLQGVARPTARQSAHTAESVSVRAR